MQEREKKERHFGTCWDALAYDAEKHWIRTAVADDGDLSASHIKYILKRFLLHRLWLH